MNGFIEVTIRDFQTTYPNPSQAAIKALETGCGNCQELAYAGALILRLAGFKGTISIGQYGINHQFLFIDNLIVDPWSGVYCKDSEWKGVINAYGGSIKDGIMRGRIVTHENIELEDEVPEVIEKISIDHFDAILEQQFAETSKPSIKFFDTNQKEKLNSNNQIILSNSKKDSKLS